MILLSFKSTIISLQTFISYDSALLQSRLAHKKADGKYVVHVGIRGNSIYLTELLNTFRKQKAKEAQIKANSLIDTINITATPIYPAPSRGASIPDATTSDVIPLVHRPSNKTIIPASEHPTHIRRSIKM